MTLLQHARIVPQKHILDNEVSEAMKTIIKDEYKMAMELVPPGCHRRNAAEVAIRNFKAHFLSVLAGAAEDFPPSLWDRLLPQTEITLNLLRQSNATPTVSAYAHLCGPFDYNKMPLAPMGCAVQVHEKTDKRGTWASKIGLRGYWKLPLAALQIDDEMIGWDLCMVPNLSGCAERATKTEALQ